jgi:ATPase subunit of ABC transporter with duplicated ATPase domains
VAFGGSLTFLSANPGTFFTITALISTMTWAGPVLEARELAKRYSAFTAVRDVSFAIGGGEILGILGPNGAGEWEGLTFENPPHRPWSG